MIAQIKDLLEMRTAQNESLDSVPHLEVYPAKYSRACTLSLQRLITAFQAGYHRGVLCRLVETFPEAKCDVIVTDPPYGFNKAVERRSLAELYILIIEKLILALKPDGQLVIAIPDSSHTGPQFPYFTNKRFITQQILITAERLGREVRTAAYSVPEPSPIFRPPFYWEAGRALRRAVLHFRIITPHC